MNIIKCVMLAFVLTLGLVGTAMATSGTVILAKGVVSATGSDKKTRVLAKGAEVKEGDIVSTGQKSFAVIRMIDNSKLTLKPGTTIAIGVFSIEEGKEEGCINLVKGGLRTVTGLIGKRKPEAFQVDTPIASIGIRGTDFITRICIGDECLNDEQELEFSLGGNDELAEQANVAESINKNLPEGLYGSCETGAVAMSQCAGQAEKFQLGKCRFDLPADCMDIELKEGQAGYTSAQTIDSQGEAVDSTLGEAVGPTSGDAAGSTSGGAADSISGEVVSSTQPNVRALPSVPLILSRDPYFELSDLSDADLDKVDRFPQGFNRSGQCSIYGS